MWSRNKAQAGFNRPQNLQAYFVEPLPFGKGKKMLNRGFASKLAGGWQLNGTFSAMQGRPFTIASSATSVNTIGNAQTGDQVKADIEVYGGIGFRSFKVRERVNLQFRWEVFNVSNTPAFGNPGATVSSASRNPDGTVKATGGFTEITSASATERRMRFALKVTF